MALVQRSDKQVPVPSDNTVNCYLPPADRSCQGRALAQSLRVRRAMSFSRPIEVLGVPQRRHLQQGSEELLFVQGSGGKSARAKHLKAASHCAFALYPHRLCIALSLHAADDDQADAKAADKVPKKCAYALHA